MQDFGLRDLITQAIGEDLLQWRHFCMEGLYADHVQEPDRVARGESNKWVLSSIKMCGQFGTPVGLARTSNTDRDTNALALTSRFGIRVDFARIPIRC